MTLVNLFDLNNHMSFNPDSINYKKSHFINGKFRDEGDDLFEYIRPSDQKKIDDIPNASQNLVDEAVQSAKKSFNESSWRSSKPRDRAKLLFKWADLIERDVESLSKIEAVNSTRTISETSAGDIFATANTIRYFAEWADKIEGLTTATSPNVLSLTMKEPYGVVVGITPWNFPLAQIAWKAAPALAAGNSVIIKPSEYTPLSIFRLAELSIKAGIPDGIFNYLLGEGSKTGHLLVTHPDVEKIAFTGSNLTGAKIMSESALAGVKPIHLELGGKTPQVVFEDINDIDSTVDKIAAGIFVNSGQVCTSGTRLIAHHKILDNVLDKLMKIGKSKIPGPTWDTNTTLPPIVSKKQAERIDRLIAESINLGAKIIEGGEWYETNYGGYFYKPTFIENINKEMPIYKEEVFGPVINVEKFDDDQEGLEKASHPNYGLAACIHTSNLNRAINLSKKIDSGMIWVNHWGYPDEFSHPAGGFKNSGIGKDMGSSGINEYYKEKAVWIAH